MKYVIIAVIILLICCVIAGAIMAIANAALYMDNSFRWGGKDG